MTTLSPTEARTNLYGVTEKELDRFVQRTRKQISRDRKAGKMKVFSGDIEADIAD